MVGCALAVFWAVGCVPEGPPTGGTKRKAPRPQHTARKTVARPKASPRLDSPFEDRFDRASLGANWRALSAAWRIDDGELCVKGAQNRGIWLRRTLPVNARIEFDARSESPDGDIKAEFWGDGRSGATGVSYTDATSYVAILGGWQNTKHVLARIDEHGDDRLAVDVMAGSSDHRARAVEPGQTYRFRVERTDERTISWSVDDKPYFELTDPEPLMGEGHDHFGFNNWMTRVCFDNVKITPL